MQIANPLVEKGTLRVEPGCGKIADPQAAAWASNKAFQLEYHHS
jgi:hypothetical protein